MVLAVLHYATLLGVAPGSPAAWILPASYAAVAVAGLVWAAGPAVPPPGRLRRRSGSAPYAVTARCTAGHRQRPASRRPRRRAQRWSAPANRDLEVLSQVIADAFHDLARVAVADPRPGRPAATSSPATSGSSSSTPWPPARCYTTPRPHRRRAVAPAAGPAAPPGGYAAQLAAATGPWLNRFTGLDDALDRHHPAGLLHHHLAILAVRPDRQGQGIGTALLDAHHASPRRQGIAAYLEASGVRTRGLYLRHGYTDHGQPIQLPGGPVMHPMMREPRPAAWPDEADGT